MNASAPSRAIRSACRRRRDAEAPLAAGRSPSELSPGLVATNSARGISAFPETDTARLVSLALEAASKAAVAEVHANRQFEEFH